MSERIRNSKFNKLTAYTAGLAIGVTALAGCGEKTANTPEDTSTGTVATSTESQSSTETSPAEADKYLRGFEVRPLSKEAQKLADRTTPDKMPTYTEDELKEVYTITERELGSYSSPEEYVQKWAEQMIVLTQATEKVGLSDDIFDATNGASVDDVEPAIQPYTEAMSRNLFGKYGELDASYYANVNTHLINEKFSYINNHVPAQQDIVEQINPESFSVTEEDSLTDSVTIEFTTNRYTKFDFNELNKLGSGVEEELLDQTVKYVVIIPSVESTDSDKAITGLVVEATVSNN